VVRRVLARAPDAPPEDLVPDHLPVYIPDFNTPRWRLTPKHYAYLKIAEGCNHPCSFCVIPQMRGKHRSRTIESVRREAEQLVGEGVKELLLISQDTTYFGMDRWTKGRGPRAQVSSSRGENLIDLLEALHSIQGDFWIRLLYTHPAHWSDELIAAIARLPKVARYVDMPLQHIEEGMLKDMRRETSEAHIRDLVKRLRAGIPGLSIRTTFIAGFPGETDSQFETLLNFIQETKFERMGVFTYSQESGSRAAKMEGQISASVKKARYRKAMAAQQKVAKEIAAAQVGKKIRILVDTLDTARTEADAPEVDGKVLLKNPLTPGSFAEVTITGHKIYDLIA
jgi:ribosomal protein S12 methylthiotransferase